MYIHVRLSRCDNRCDAVTHLLPEAHCSVSLMDEPALPRHRLAVEILQLSPLLGVRGRERGTSLLCTLIYPNYLR